MLPFVSFPLLLLEAYIKGEESCAINMYMLGRAENGP